MVALFQLLQRGMSFDHIDNYDEHSFAISNRIVCVQLILTGPKQTHGNLLVLAQLLDKHLISHLLHEHFTAFIHSVLVFTFKWSFVLCTIAGSFKFYAKKHCKISQILLNRNTPMCLRLCDKHAFALNRAHHSN